MNINNEEKGTMMVNFCDKVYQPQCCCDKKTGMEVILRMYPGNGTDRKH